MVALITVIITDVKALSSGEIGCYVGDRWAIDLRRVNRWSVISAIGPMLCRRKCVIMI